MRRLDWPERLAQFLSEADGRSFSETYSCVVFAADAVKAMTDYDPLPVREDTVSAAYARMRREGYQNILEALSAKIGQPIPLSLARRGDVILRRVGDDEAIGICCGEQTAFISDSGIAYWPTLEQFAAFRVR
jgi:hypothetical protein